MENYDDRNYLEKCKKDIENIVGIGESANWKQRDYEYLCEQIYGKTKINISLSTIKRIWNASFKNTPQPATLNALAIFLGFEDWNSYKKDIIIPAEPIQNEGKNGFKKYSYSKSLVVRIIVAFMLAGIALGSYWLYHQMKFKQNLKDIEFSLKKTETDFPNSVGFSYDVSSISPRKVAIQQSWDPRMNVEVSPQEHYRTCIYFYPGCTKAQLLADGKVLKETEFLLNTNGWMSYVVYQFWDSIPVYIRNVDFSTKKEIYLSPDQLARSGVKLDKDYYVNYSLVKDFGMSSDSFKFETNIKNNIEEGGLLCQRTWIVIFGENGWINIPLTAKGCISDINLICSDVFLDGKKNDLSMFGCDMNQWHNLKVENKNRKVSILLDNKQIFNSIYKNGLGKIVEISYVFKGCGSFKDISLQKLNGEVVYKFPN